MMYPRLKLARNLLTEDGVILICIDETSSRTSRICDEVFGASNFVAQCRNIVKLEGRRTSSSLES